MPQRRIPITDAALRLGETYQQVRNKLLRRTLKGGRDEFGRLYVDGADLRKARRSLGPSTARPLHRGSPMDSPPASRLRMGQHRRAG